MGGQDKTNAMRALERMGIAYEQLSYASDGAPVDACTAAGRLGVPETQVYKTLVLLGSDRRHYVCVISGPAELDMKRAAAHFGVKSVAMLPLAQLKAVTGYERGGCSPVGMKKALPCALDQSALALPRIVISGGHIGRHVRIAPDDLLRAAAAQAAALCREPAP